MQHPDPTHADHDVTLIASHAAGDLVDSERARAQALLETCASCADVERDLVAIARATRALPKRAAAPRDFRLTPEQAAHLRRGNWLRAVLAPFGAARSATRPLAAAFTSLGLVGLLVVTILPGLGGSAASMGAPRDQAITGAGASAAPAGPASGPGAAPGPNETAAAPDNAYGGKEGVSASSVPEAEIADDAGRDAAPAPVNLPLVGSLVLLAIGLGMFGLRFASRRLR